MDPITMGIMALSFLGSAQSADQQRKEAEYSKRLARINQKRMEMMATESVKQGEKDAASYGHKVKAMTGSQKAALAAQGIDISFGSAEKVIEDTQTMGSDAINTIRNNAFREALGYKLKGQEEVRMAEMGQSAANQRSNLTLLTGAIQAGQTYLSNRG